MKLKVLNALLTLCCTLPIWYYLLYKILTLVESTELMWFLFWVYIPFGIAANLTSQFMEKES